MPCVVSMDSKKNFKKNKVRVEVVKKNTEKEVILSRNKKNYYKSKRNFDFCLVNSK